MVFRQGQVANGLYIVRKGWLRLFRADTGGRRIVLGIVSPGYSMGLVSLVTKAPFFHTAETLEDCELEFVPESSFSRILEQNPVLALKLLRELGERLRRSHQKLYGLEGGKPSAGRLLSVLEHLAQACGQRTPDGIRLSLPFTVQDLADEIGCSRQWTTALLTELESRNLIQRKSGWIVLMSHKMGGKE